LATSGDQHLGGNDFDQILTEYTAAEFKKETDVDINTAKRSKSKWRVRKECTNTKICLSVAMSADIDLASLAEDEDLFVPISRAKLEDLCK